MSLSALNKRRFHSRRAWSSRIAAIAALTLSTGACGGDGGTNPAEPAPDPNADRIEITYAYAAGTSQKFETMDLFQSTKDGRLARLFISTPDVEVQPEWSNDGSKLTFVRFTGPLLAPATLWIANADGSGLRQLVIDPSTSTTSFNNQTVPTWSPDAARLAFNRSIGGTQMGIAVIDADGSNLQWLTMNGSDPSWSVTNRIAFSRSGQIWTMLPDGTGLTQVTPLGGDVVPKWSRDASRLVFNHSVGSASGTAYDVVTTRADGTDRRTLVTGGNNVNPTWSPDGQFILFEYVDFSDVTAPKCLLKKVSATGGPVSTLTPDRGAGTCGGASWRPM